MFPIINKQIIADNTKRIDVKAERIAHKAKPGQFVMVMTDEHSERIPLSIIDTQPDKGLISLVFKETSAPTKRLGARKIDESLFAVLGPLGMPVNLPSSGVVVCIGYDLGIAQILPFCRALKNLNNKVIGIVGAPTQKALFFESQLRLSCHKLLITTDDGSYMRRGSAVGALRELLALEKVNAVYGMGPADILSEISESTKQKKIKTIVGLQPVMVSGIGLCGACRVNINRQPVLACVEGPCFDSHHVDFKDLLHRTKTSKETEQWQNQTSLLAQKRNGSKTFLKSLVGLVRNKL